MHNRAACADHAPSPERPTGCRSAAASAPETDLKKGTISRAKRSAATAGWAAGIIAAGMDWLFLLYMLISNHLIVMHHDLCIGHAMCIRKLHLKGILIMNFNDIA